MDGAGATNGFRPSVLRRIQFAAHDPLLVTEDAREGPTAFAPKRKPEYKGR